MADNPSRPRFAIYRARDARPYDDDGPMHAAGPMPPVAARYTRELHDAGMEAGNDVRLLFAAPGLSLTYVWFKSGFPLPRHSHDADCLYYIIAGALAIGTETLGAGDGFFLGADMPYAYTAGPDGVELLEFRTADRFDIKLLAENPSFWTKAIEQVRQHSAAWQSEAKPSAGQRSP